MRRRVRLTEGQLRNIVERASRRVIREMMDEGLGDTLWNAGKNIVQGGLKTVGNLGALAGGTVASVPLLAASIGAGAASTALGDGYSAGAATIEKPYGDYMTQGVHGLWNGIKQIGRGLTGPFTASYNNQASGSTQQQRR